MSWLLSTVLRWTLGCTCLFQFWFPWCVCPPVGLLVIWQLSLNRHVCNMVPFWRMSQKLQEKETVAVYYEHIIWIKNSQYKNNFFFWLCLMALGILVLQPRIEPESPALKKQSLNHWTARKFSLVKLFLFHKILLIICTREDNVIKMQGFQLKK